jgi:hypothetical protein
VSAEKFRYDADRLNFQEVDKFLVRADSNYWPIIDSRGKNSGAAVPKNSHCTASSL